MMKNKYLLLFLILVLVNNAFPDNYHSGNKLLLTFSDNGVIENKDGVAAEWPTGTGHEYLNLAFPIVAVENNNQRQVAKFTSIDNIAAFSHLEETWADEWNGQWNGLYAYDSLNADQESWCVLEDTDLKLRLTIRGFQWSHYLAQDMIFLHYEIENYGSSSYQNTAFGLFVDPAVGGDDDDDIVSFNKDEKTVIVMDKDNKGKGRGTAKGIGAWSPVGRLGINILEAPPGGSSFAAYERGDFDVSDNNAVWSALTPDRFDRTENAETFVIGSGYFSLEPDSMQQFSLVIFVNANELDIERNQEIINQIYANNYTFPVAPPRPNLYTVRKSGEVTLYWDTNAESVADFEGYKIYRSSDPGFNDVFTVTDDRGILIYSDPMATFDVYNDVSGLFPKHIFGFRYYLGKNSGLQHRWTDTNVINGKTYYYAVVAFDRGNAEEDIHPTESTKSIVIENDGNIIADVNTARVMPIVESSGYEAPDFFMEHTDGFATGDIIVEIVDRTLLKDGNSYQITFNDTISDDTTYYSIYDITGSKEVVNNSSTYISEDYYNDISPFFDGINVSLRDDDLAWNPDSTYWKSGNSNWDAAVELNANLGQPVAVAADYEMRFGGANMDTAVFTQPIPVPFQIWNVTDRSNVYKENVLVYDVNANGEWDVDERIFIVEGDTITDFKPVYWSLTFTVPEDSAVFSISPDSCDVLLISTFKPFTSNDKYLIITQGALIKSDLGESVLNNVAVIPNPYIVYSGFEQKSQFTSGYDNKIQFVNLPQKCTIKIYNMRGYHIKTIEHCSGLYDGSEFWDLQNKRGELVAYGVFIYHIDAPGIGEKIGKFAIIR
ncbi:hypothetical protein KJ656_02690 [bacterium]|nr:hypothetical protein [bacterium]